MASNQFGKIFRILTWGESHGKAIGVVIDGCPAGVKIDEEAINRELSRRAPGKTPWTSPRKETDRVELLSGIFAGETTGAPISMLIWNQDAQSDTYEPLKDLLRPGHANYTYLQKYGVFDYRGAGRASARETACRVAAGAIAKQILSDVGVQVLGFLRGVGDELCDLMLSDDIRLNEQLIRNSPIFCPCKEAEQRFVSKIEKLHGEGDSIGGIVEASAWGVPVGLGDPVYGKLDAALAEALLSIPACKSFEIGSGSRSAAFRGSEHNDLFRAEGNGIKTESNHAGGTLGGISTGMPIIVRASFKPASSIALPQRTIDSKGQSSVLELPKGSRHDPCVAIRAVPVVEAMVALTLVDAWLMNRLSKY